MILTVPATYATKYFADKSNLRSYFMCTFDTSDVDYIDVTYFNPGIWSSHSLSHSFDKQNGMTGYISSTKSSNQNSSDLYQLNTKHYNDFISIL